jgi:hypothetical protein
MNNPFDYISGQIIIKGRAYSAKEVIRGLLEQGIAITENEDGLKIGFKHFQPLSNSEQILEENNSLKCPFIPYISQITTRLDELSASISLSANSSLNSAPSQQFSQSRNAAPSNSSSSPHSSFFSPFDNPSFQSSKQNDKEKFFSSSFLDKHDKCSSCGATLPQNAFFCNKCGSHVRSG